MQFNIPRTFDQYKDQVKKTGKNIDESVYNYTYKRLKKYLIAPLSRIIAIIPGGIVGVIHWNSGRGKHSNNPLAIHIKACVQQYEYAIYTKCKIPLTLLYLVSSALAIITAMVITAAALPIPMLALNMYDAGYNSFRSVENKVFRKIYDGLINFGIPDHLIPRTPILIASITVGILPGLINAVSTPILMLAEHVAYLITELTSQAFMLAKSAYRTFRNIPTEYDYDTYQPSSSVQAQSCHRTDSSIQEHRNADLESEPKSVYVTKQYEAQSRKSNLLPSSANDQSNSNTLQRKSGASYQP